MNTYPNGKSLVRCITDEITYCDRYDQWFMNHKPSSDITVYYGCLSYFREEEHYDNYLNSLNT